MIRTREPRNIHFSVTVDSVFDRVSVKLLYLENDSFDFFHFLTKVAWDDGDHLLKKSAKTNEYV